MHAFSPITLVLPPVACWVLKKGAKESTEKGMCYLNGLVCRQWVEDAGRIRQANEKEMCHRKDEGDESKQH